jgi:hypothetical protein
MLYTPVAWIGSVGTGSDSVFSIVRYQTVTPGDTGRVSIDLPVRPDTHLISSRSDTRRLTLLPWFLLFPLVILAFRAEDKQGCRRQTASQTDSMGSEAVVKTATSALDRLLRPSGRG